LRNHSKMNLKASQNNPLVSIVTATFNAEKYIQKLFDSIRNQSYQNIEFIVIDGESSDKTLEIIRKNIDIVDYFISEKDCGISDAFNKGIKAANGEFILFIGADDWYCDEAVEILVNNSKPELEVVCACSTVVEPETLRFVKKYHSNPDQLNKKMSLAHNACLIRRSAIAEVGWYDTSKKIAMDHHLFLRILKKFGRKAFFAIDAPISFYRLGGISHTNEIRGFQEVRDNLIEHGETPLVATLRYYILILKSTINSFLKNRK